ncbi:MAG: N-6 DNA methylase [Chloroflexota bacterium]|nr:N-6 DNA methylase [Chloroflexota bacterium]MDE2959267.1 N-6 DNA methylase [Chloroflexota bacterium]
MATEKEQETFGLVIDRHRSGDTENDIRLAFIRFMETAGIADLPDMATEGPPGVGHAGRMDLYVHNTCIEFKTDILRNGAPNPEHVAQLDGYIENLLKAGSGVRNGVLTDGVHYFLRRVGEEKLPLQRGETHRTFDRPEQAPRLREYLHGIISAPAENVSPTAENLERHFGSDSDAFRAGNLLLQEAYAAHRDDPTVAVKRRLWQDLLQVALGKDAATAGDESDWLFIRHTYVTSLIAVIMQQQLLGDVARHASERPDALLKGRILAEQSDLHGVIDADLFTWPTEVGESAYLREIARVVEQFDWTQSPREVAPTLYQNVITPEERKRLGEYYTPRWLAQEITEAVVDDPLHQRALDPSCGSGTFIETAVERIISHAGELSAAATLRKLQENVVGIDIHPVAVQLAKATWVMAAADTIRAARAESTDTGTGDMDTGTGAVSAPIYLGDSMQLRYDTGTLTASQSIELETRETLPGHAAPVTFSIPRELARQQADVDRLISEMAAAIDSSKIREGRDAERVVDGYPMSDECRRSMKAVAATMGELHAAGRNHVWAYYIRNMIRPAVIAEEKVDRIIGNPPWLTYGQSADIIREELRGMSEQRYRIWAGGKLAPHQDIATLFYTRCAELYARDGAVIGMVLPHSALRSGQHLKWRGGAYRRRRDRSAPSVNVNFQVQEPWDLDNVTPDFFPMPASVVFAEYTAGESGKPLAPGTVRVWRGDWQDDYAGITRQSEALHHDDGTYKSPYAELSSQGPTIYDRRLFFVETIPHTAMLPAANTTNIKPRLGSQDKVTYAGELNKLDGVVGNDHLFDVYVGECIAPYVALDPLKAALPVHRSTMTMPLNHDECTDNKHDACRLEVEALHSTMQRRWTNAVAMFRDAHAGRSITELLANLNHLNKMTDQLESLRAAANDGDAIRVAYTTSGEPTAAIVASTNAIVESTSYQTICRSKNEAYYLLAIINSNELAKQAKPFCPTNWAKEIRHFHKHGWKLPIPRYDAGDALHVRLSELGATAEQECQAIIAESDIMSRPAGDAQSRAARRLLRHEWQPNSATARAIEEAVGRLLSEPGQAALAARQMTSTKIST